MNIINQEIIQESVMWPTYIVAAVVILAMFALLVISIVTRKPEKFTAPMMIVGMGGLLVFFIINIICASWFKVDTDRYRYEATFEDSYSINELYENYTNIQYNEETGTYTFEDKE